jgi:hypothetical protein
VESRLRHLRHLGSWCDQWCNPIVFALYREDAAECESKLGEARAALDTSGLSPDDRLALRLQLAYLEFQIKCNLSLDPQPNAEAWREMLWRLQVEPVGEMSALLKACLLLVVRVLGDTRGHSPFAENELDALFAQITARDLDAELWYYIAYWAVEHRNRNYITLAYGEMLTEPSGYLRHDTWLRVNLIYLLLEGRAQERDILETIKVFTHYNQLRRFDEAIWPLVQEKGLDTPGVIRAVEQKRAALDARPLEPPRF